MKLRRRGYRVAAVVGAALLGLLGTTSTAAAELVVHDIAEIAPQEDGLLGGIRTNGHFLVIGSPPARVFDVAPDGTMTPAAGCGCADIGQGLGDGGPATSALVDQPIAVEPTSDGGFLVAHQPLGDAGSLIRKVSAGGTITTVAGTGSGTVSGDGGPATDAGLGFATSVSEVPGGGFLITGYGHSVRYVNSDGDISTVAGTGVPGFSGEDGPATAAQLNEPSEVVSVPDGFLVRDAANCRIRRVDGDNNIDTVAGTGEMHEVGAPPDVHEQCVVHGENYADEFSALDEPLTFQGLTPLPDGGFATFTGGYTRLLAIDSSSVARVVMGLGLGGWGGDGCPASDVALQGPNFGSLLYDDGTYYYVDDSSLHDGHLWSVLRSVSEGTVTDCEIIGIDGTPKADDVDGGHYAENVKAANGSDTIEGGGGGDKLLGQDGNDEIDAGAGKDTASGGTGNDKIDIAGGGTDKANCGSGHDVVNESGGDKVASNCEVVK